MSTPTNPAPLWHQQPGEGVKAFRAFKTYCHLGADRSIKAAHRAVTKDNVPDVPGRWKEWSVTYRWTERVAAWDNAQTAAAEKAEDAARDRRFARLDELRKEAELEQHAELTHRILRCRDFLDKLDEDAKLSSREVTQTKTEIVDGKAVVTITRFRPVKARDYAAMALAQKDLAGCRINGQRAKSELIKKADEAISRVEYSWCPPEDLINTESDTGPSPASDDSTANKASGKDSPDP